ncbi:uncharacterized protein LOC141655778 [Silene latifolia]|uniref:uncharacterized protein LOC141655778 n=1 Tax=Silene latifolia TaxID=37657 RepID=UPI003D786479
MSVAVYYSKLSQLWDELDKYEPIIKCKCQKCDCDVEKQHVARRDSERLHQFLLGLLPQPYESLRSVLLSQNPLPTLHRAFHIILREELARTQSPPPLLMRRMAAAEEEFANLKEKVEFFCDKYEINYDWQMRKPDKWGAQRQTENDKPVYCVALSHDKWSLKNEDFSSDEVQSFIIQIFILVPENCSLYHFANFIASSEGTACVAANSKIYVFGGGCGTRVWYMDAVGEGDKQGKEWKQAKACFNREKCNPLSFSLGNKIYALETLYFPTSGNGYGITEEQIGKVDDDYCFEVLDTSTDGSCWRSLCKPPFPFGGSAVNASWSSDGGDDQNDDSRIFIEACYDYTKYLFVYDVGIDTWGKFKQHCPLKLVHHPSLYLDYNPFYTWALHSIGKDFAPFPPHEPYTGDLRVLTGLKRSIPELQQIASECQKGLSLPFPVRVETDRMVKLSVPCKNSSRCLTGMDLESLWTLHCLPVEKMIFWQAIHLGGSSFCTLAYYIHTFCCSKHTHLYARVANFDITTDAAAAGVDANEPVFSAEYGANKLYLVSKGFGASPLPCSKLQPV